MSPNLNFNAQQAAAVYQSIQDVGAVLKEVGMTTPTNLVNKAPYFAQKLQTAVQRYPNPMVQQVVLGTSALLKQLHAFQMRRKMEYLVRPTIPISVAWDNLAANTLGAQAFVSAPYSGQPYRLTDVRCTAGASFRFVEFNIGGIDFAEPSRTRVNYNGVVGVPGTATRGIDFPQIKARDMTSTIDANWAPWVKADFSSDATISLTPYNYGTTASSCILTLFLRSNPCGQTFKSSMLVPMAEQAKKNAIMGATYFDSIDPDSLV